MLNVDAPLELSCQQEPLDKLEIQPLSETCYDPILFVEITLKDWCKTYLSAEDARKAGEYLIAQADKAEKEILQDADI